MSEQNVKDKNGPGKIIIIFYFISLYLWQPFKDELKSVPRSLFNEILFI
jgi:hypothetical protein